MRSRAHLPEDGAALRQRDLRRSAAALLGVLAVTLLLTWPLAAHIRSNLPMSHLVARTDALVAGWTLAWQTQALLHAPLQVADANIFHPSPNALFYGPMGVGALPLFAPVFAVTADPALALNVTFLLGVALTAWTMLVVVAQWTGSWSAGAVAAATLLGSSWLVRGMVATAPFAAALFYLPVIAFLAATRSVRLREALWLAPLIALQCLVDVVYVAPAVLLPLGVLAATRLGRTRTRTAGIALGAALALAVLLMAPVLAGYAAVRLANPDLAQQTFWHSSPIPLRLPDGIFAYGSSRAVPPVVLALVALGALLHVASGRPRRPSGGHAAPPHAGEPPPCSRRGASAWRHGALWLVVGVVISLPPVGMIGTHAVKLPIGLLGDVLPSLRVLRTHDRVGVAALIGMALLAGAATAEIERRLGRAAAAMRPRSEPPSGLRTRSRADAVSFLARAVAPVLVVAIYASSYAPRLGDGLLPEPMALFRRPRWSDAAARVLRDAPGAVLEVPFPPPDEPNTAAHARAMFRSTQHWRPLLNGHHSYFPRDYPERIALASRVPDPEAIRRLHDEAGLGTIAVALDFVMPEEQQRWQRLAASPPASLKLLHRASNELVFAVTQEDDASPETGP